MVEWPSGWQVPLKRDQNPKSARDVFTASDTKAQQLKKELAAASAAADAKTARLRKLRLEKERQEDESGVQLADMPKPTGQVLPQCDGEHE